MSIQKEKYDKRVILYKEDAQFKESYHR